MKNRNVIVASKDLIKKEFLAKINIKDGGPMGSWCGCSKLTTFFNGRTWVTIKGDEGVQSITTIICNTCGKRDGPDGYSFSE